MTGKSLRVQKMSMWGLFLCNGKGMICRACIPLSGREEEFLSEETVNDIAWVQELWYTVPM